MNVEGSGPSEAISVLIRKRPDGVFPQSRGFYAIKGLKLIFPCPDHLTDAWNTAMMSWEP
jgi:hypothetical protein